jgi:hypothetical protein
VISVQENASAPTITSNIWRRIQVATADWAAVECPLNLRSYRWGRKRKLRCDPVYSGETQGYKLPDSRPCGFLQGNGRCFRR